MHYIATTSRIVACRAAQTIIPIKNACRTYPPLNVIQCDLHDTDESYAVDMATTALEDAVLNDNEQHAQALHPARDHSAGAARGLQAQELHRPHQPRVKEAEAVVVIHSMAPLSKLCTSGAVLNSGKITYYGNVEKVIA